MKEFLYKVGTNQVKGAHIETLKLLLWIVSLLFALTVFLRKLLYRLGIIPSAQLSKPVISVGNITTGGVGKTPLVIYLAEKIKEKGKSPAILIRGYMDEKDAHSDEAQLLRNKLDTPILVGKNRLQSAQKFLTSGSCDCFLLDDGFQHLRIQRNLDIVLVDAANPWGGGYLLPRGFLRESPKALGRAGVIVLTRTDQAEDLNSIKDQIQAINSDALILESVHEPVELMNLVTEETLPLSDLKHKDICSLSSIGSPKSFDQTLESLGAQIKKSFHFMDHHLFNKGDIQSINAYCQKHQIKTILTTEKDQMKLSGLRGFFPSEVDVWVLRISISIKDNEDALIERCTDIL